MAREESDLREFIRWHTARSDRMTRELFARLDSRIARSDRVIEENSRVIDKAIHAMDELRDGVRAEIRDERDERRALIGAVMQLIDRINALGDKIDRWNPGGASA